MLVERKVILEKEGINLIVLEKYMIGKDLDFLSAKNELFEYASNSDVWTWGYFPEINDDESKYPQCIKLKKWFDSFVDDSDHKLTFIRLAIKEPKSEFGGFHIDADAGAGHSKHSYFEGKEVLRILINCGTFPRKLGFVDKTRDELIKEGFDIPSDKYKILKFPEEMIKTIDIPSREEGYIWVLKFWASIIPHFGLTDKNGHFLVAYGAWKDFRGL